MSSSSKRRRPPSKKNSAVKARVISVKRTDVLPRTGNASTGPRKSVLKPPAAAGPATAAVDSKKKDRRPQPAKSLLTRPRKTGAAGRASDKRSEPAAMDVPPLSQDLVPDAVEAIVETELEVEASAIVEETTIVDAPFAFPNQRKGLFAAVTSRLLSTLRWWTGLRR